MRRIVQSTAQPTTVSAKGMSRSNASVTIHRLPHFPRCTNSETIQRAPAEWSRPGPGDLAGAVTRAAQPAPAKTRSTRPLARQKRSRTGTRLSLSVYPTLSARYAPATAVIAGTMKIETFFTHWRGRSNRRTAATPWPGDRVTAEGGALRFALYPGRWSRAKRS
jgi:hypothetical protein